jgi:hypothetical protein
MRDVTLLCSAPKLVGIAFGFMLLGTIVAAVAGERPLHFAVNVRGDYAGALSTGFNLADVGTLSALNALPKGMKGVFWLGNGYNSTCSWRLNDQEVINFVNAIKHNSKFSGIYYISDEPHPARCPDAPKQLAERTRLIHSLDPNGKTFIIVLNSSTAPSEFAQLKDSADYIGVDPYPCNVNNGSSGCNYRALRERIDLALAAGIPSTRIVPVFQSFGQSCTTSNRNYYRLPTVAETEAMLAIWDEKVPVKDRPFDMAYSWGIQPHVACPALQTADGRSYPDLRSVYKSYFSRMNNPIGGR